MAGPVPALLPSASTQRPHGGHQGGGIGRGGLWGYSAPPYLSPQGLKDCVTDLLQPFQGDPIDLVAGIDAMGFILGAAVAATLHKGFLAIRKAGPWGGHSYSGVTMGAGIQLCPSPGMRILLVDQWVETGGTMRAAIQLVERQGGVVLCQHTALKGQCCHTEEEIPHVLSCPIEEES
uniref:adenine phosphoribosyltransferase n=1 Tax=Phasianus colchicus TaxID=9054 RepID=A0A669P5G3_PHACC